MTRRGHGSDDAAEVAALLSTPAPAAVQMPAGRTLCRRYDADESTAPTSPQVSPSEPVEKQEAPEFDPDDGSTYPCAWGGDCGCVGTGLRGCPGQDEDARDRARERAEHVHDPFVAWDETGKPYTTCECGTRWEPAPCQVCGVPVAALYIARTGRARHGWHPEKD